MRTGTIVPCCAAGTLEDVDEEKEKSKNEGVASDRGTFARVSIR